MPAAVPFRDLRYVRIATDDLAEPSGFAAETLGLQPSGATDGRAFFRSDARAYSVCFSTADETDAVALTVATDDDLASMSERLTSFGIAVKALDDADCAARSIKKGIACRAPNGIAVEFVWRPLASGWRYHGPRDAGIVEFSSVALATTDVAADEDFWTRIVGLSVSDWAGDAVFLRLDDAHHRIALYPSQQNGLLGIDFAVEGINNVMQNFYFFQGQQLPVVHGPGRQPTSGKAFVTTRGPRDLLYTFSTGMDRGPDLDGRVPRQFPAEAGSHCAWGSPTTQPEFLGNTL
ncbi:VOC family protein [Amorphus orientalis]|uniref:2,3-dihydroxy-p-cumate/2,3-dihydroxybenzoate 3,4-dioxygenase n=1 Tax=Amorphus orientalis TaxID=649198 RepID=A0AAE3VMI0_9HYPH|nr:VOC family protein [Amorphus orientalis]MDQ0314406.1 2,3-dihydroxy-p-cumate/2,3-dihydroxybenzoate 3,4-dioxygenase [Amorphus orientalis]